MDGQWIQYVAGGATSGAIYALVALGFSIIYNASGAINFAQGEFVMIGGMSAVTLVGAPSYTSGIHMWTGAAATLNPSPTRTRPAPTAPVPMTKVRRSLFGLLVIMACRPYAFAAAWMASRTCSSSGVSRNEQ
mgnify:CR=1 FL=1